MAQSHDGDPAGHKRIGIILFDQFETLDVFGPVQMLGRLPDYRLVAITQDGGPVTSSQGLATVAHFSFATAPQLNIVLVPGGMGTRKEVENPVLLNFLRTQSAGADYVTSVCTGSALLAKAGILDGRSATTNKVAFDWVAGQSDKVAWQRHARWVEDGTFLTSSGVSAGTDMALALVAKLYGREAADKTAREAEYVWNDDPDQDPFAIR
ncbi:DJ-1/PfpI family protein [Sphingomonas sp. ASY06-1R]|uniref:DJ-1/PfpI family protein n=1 Tax=Sphingomonas sp. ASY06-1R TaxID=3445771 RepID=UPI003FA2AF67